MSRGPALPASRDWARALALALVGAAVLWLMGRVPICSCGYVALWHGDPHSAENSQHLFDWYTPSHVLHGLVFYAALRPFLVAPAPAWPLAAPLLARLGLRPAAGMGPLLRAATAIEVAWEIVENSPPVIARYREATIALGYTGDSIVNSMADVAAMWAGLLFAARAPVWASVALFAGAEILTGVVIRDGLLLNVLMLLWPLEAVLRWQQGG